MKKETGLNLKQPRSLILTADPVNLGLLKFNNMMKINEEFKKLIPALTVEEFATLEQSILNEGIRDAIVMWNGFIIDGHNRYQIALKHELEFDTIEKEFESEDEAKVWMIDNQKGRRNLTDGWKYKLEITKNEIILKKQGKENQLRKPESVLATIAKTKPHNTRNEIAKNLDWSTGKVAMADVVFKKAPVPIQEKVLSGEISINEAYIQNRREEKKQVQEEKFEVLRKKEVEIITTEYDVIVIDPPWQMEKIQRDVAPLQVGFDYPTMTIEEISKFELPAAKDCHVFMWITHKQLPFGFEILKEWNAKYVCTFVWHKNGGFQPFGLPQYNCEFILYARIGTPAFADLKAFNTCFSANRAGHSEKPNSFYEMVKRVTVGKRIDIFNRREIDGFDLWGNEAF